MILYHTPPILLLFLLVCFGSNHLVAIVGGELSCSIESAPNGERKLDPALKEMKYDIGYGEQTFMAYMEPHVTTFYKDVDPPASTKVVPKFTGLATKFINMSNKPVKLYWEPYVNGNLESMGFMEPFAATGTASHTGHIFVFATPDEKPEILHRVYIGEHPENNYFYDPYFVEGDPQATEENLQQALNDEERTLYNMWRDTLNFSGQYLNFTGRSYLANYLRHPPKHYMWPADYFGQEHWVETKETHFVMTPSDQELQPIRESGTERVLKENDPRLLQEYRDPSKSTLNMTLKVLSVAPRVFEIPNFLSPVEVDHVLKVAGGVTLGRSSVGDIGRGKEQLVEVESATADTRTSLNSWISREKSPIFDAIYRRAADLMRIDEALLRERDEEEVPEWSGYKNSLAESLQLVHYAVGQKYTAHHDFGFSDLDNAGPESDEFAQGTRFATLLLYLNSDGLEGGETSFPRWSNAETFDQLRVNPEEGKAVLFYSQLPDGNLDDFSQHAALAPKNGEKWLINLWVWDPVYE